MDDGFGETGCVVFDAHGFVGFVEFGAADSIDLADATECSDGLFGGGCAKAIHYVKLRHTSDFSRGRRGLRGKFFEIGDEVRGGEVLRTDELAADDALLVDDVGFGEAEAAVEGVGLLVLVEDGEHGDVALCDVGLVLAVVFVAGDANDLNLGELLLQGDERWHLLDAGGAPAGPEVENDDLAAIVGEVDGVLPVGDGEDGGGVAELAGAGVAIAAGGEEAGQGGEGAKADCVLRPHSSYNTKL